MRRILLWMATNPWMRRNIPRLWIARRAVRRFMPGESVDDALKAADNFKSSGFPVLLTRLGENVTRAEQYDEVAHHYGWLIEECAKRGLEGEVSVKPTQLGMDVDP